MDYSTFLIQCYYLVSTSQQQNYINFMNYKILIFITEYEKAAKILEEKESKVKLAKVDATIHTLSAKEHQVSKNLTQASGIIAEQSRASIFGYLDRGRGPEFESRQGMADNIYGVLLRIHMSEDHDADIVHI